MRLFFLFLLSVSAVLTGACDFQSSPAPAPAFVQIDSVKLATTGLQGTPSSRITAVNVIVAGNNLGVFELPAKIPVLASGSTTLNIIPCVYANGITSQLLIYPFYNSPSVTLELVPGQTLKITPVTSYIGSIASPFVVKEDFENPEFSIVKTDSSKLPVTRTNNPEYLYPDGGKFSGFVATGENDTVNYISLISKNYFNLPTNNTAIVLEFDYKTNDYISVNMKQYLGTTWSDFIGQYGVNPSPTTWKHAYFFFTDEVYSNASKGYRYKVWLQSYTKGGGAHFLAIDNVRLVTIH